MQKSESTKASVADILAVAVAGIIQVTVTSGPATLWNVMTGTILLFILASHRIVHFTRVTEIFALSTAWALTLILTGAYFAQVAFPYAERTADLELHPRYYFIAWLVLSVLVSIILLTVQRVQLKSAT